MCLNYWAFVRLRDFISDIDNVKLGPSFGIKNQSRDHESQIEW